MRQILFVVRNFPPVRNSGTIRMESFARYLPGYAYRPTVIHGAIPSNLQDSTDRLLPAGQRIEIDWNIPKSPLRRRWGTLPIGYSLERSRGRTQLSARSINALLAAHCQPDLIFATRGLTGPLPSTRIGSTISSSAAASSPP